MVPAMELKGKVTFSAIFTMLGVNEFRRDAANLTRFNECMAGVAQDMRDDLGDLVAILLGASFPYDLGVTSDSTTVPTHNRLGAWTLALGIAFAPF